MLDPTNTQRPRRIVHVDINSYFATISQQQHRQLRGKPVGIVKEKGRTCLIAVSKEAKKFGVKTGCRLAEAQRLCPEIITWPAEFDLYLETTKKLHQMFLSLVPDVDLFSLDEAFLDLSDCNQYYPDLHQFGRLVQEKIFETLGEVVTCNVGISWNKFLAKMASETAPKGSITEITRDNLDQYLLETDFEDICGIGHRLAPRLKALGIDNLYALNLFTDDWLVEHFGKFYARELRKMSRGEEPHFLGLPELPAMKSVSRSITGWDLCADETEIRRVIYNLTAEVCTKARKMSLTGRQVGISLSGEDRGWRDHITLKAATNQTHEVFDLLYHRLYRSWQRDFKIIKFRVRLGLLESDIQPKLFGQWQRFQSLYQAMDSINRRYGEHVVHAAAMHSGRIIHEEVTGYLGDKQYQFGFR